MVIICILNCGRADFAGFGLESSRASQIFANALLDQFMADKQDFSSFTKQMVNQFVNRKGAKISILTKKFFADLNDVSRMLLC